MKKITIIIIFVIVFLINKVLILEYENNNLKDQTNTAQTELKKQIIRNKMLELENIKQEQKTLDLLNKQTKQLEDTLTIINQITAPDIALISLNQ